MKKQIKTTLPTKSNAVSTAVLGANDDVSLSKYINEIQKFPILTAQQEYEYATKWANEHDNIAAEKSLGYAFFYETPPPEGEPNIPVAGWFDDPIFIWQGSESYNPDIPIEEVDIVEAFRKRAVKAEKHSRGN